MELLWSLSPNIHHLTLECNRNITANLLLRYFESNPAIADSLTHLKLLHLTKPEQMVPPLTKLLHNLKFLELSASSMFAYVYRESLTDLIDDLVKLKHLEELRLHEFYLEPDESLEHKCLPSVKRLTFATFDVLGCYALYFEQEHFDPMTFAHILAQQFPNLESLTLISYQDQPEYRGMATKLRRTLRLHCGPKLTQIRILFRSPEYRQLQTPIRGLQNFMMQAWQIFREQRRENRPGGHMGGGINRPQQPAAAQPELEANNNQNPDEVVEVPEVDQFNQGLQQAILEAAQG